MTSSAVLRGAPFVLVAACFLPCPSAAIAASRVAHASVPRAAAATRAAPGMTAPPPPEASVTSTRSASPPASPPSRAASPKRRAPPMSNIWELDLYTRPVTNDQGKKLWELLVCDANGVMRHVEPLPSSLINSRELRKRVQALIDRAPVRPAQIRFFRAEMQSMIGVALSELPVLTVPTRRTYALRNWLDQRARDVYPALPGFRADLAAEERARPSAAERTPVKMPDALRGDQWAFVNLPLHDLSGPQATIDASNVGFGSLFPVDELDLDPSTSVPGVLITSQRAEPLSAWMSGTELAAISVDLEGGDLTLEVGIDTQYMFAKLWGLEQREEAADFLRACRKARGLHFIAVQRSFDEEGVQGFWLLRNYDVL